MKDASVLIVDDDKLICDSLALTLRKSGINVVGTTTSGIHAIDLVESLDPDLVIFDYQMPGIRMTDFLRFLRQNKLNVKVIIYSAWAKPDYLARSIIHGANRYVSKEISSENLLRIIKQVLSTEDDTSRKTVEAAIDTVKEVVFPNVQRKSPPSGSILTDQEIRILSLVAEGLNNDEISKLISRSQSTVKTHVRNILDKLNVPDRTSAAIWAHNNAFKLE